MDPASEPGFASWRIDLHRRTDGLRNRQSLKLTQSLIMTQKLQQAIKLLQLSRLELEGEIQQVLETNPVLEDAELQFEEKPAAEEELGVPEFSGDGEPAPEARRRQRRGQVLRGRMGLGQLFERPAHAAAHGRIRRTGGPALREPQCREDHPEVPPHLAVADGRTGRGRRSHRHPDHRQPGHGRLSAGHDGGDRRRDGGRAGPGGRGPGGGPGLRPAGGGGPEPERVPPDPDQDSWGRRTPWCWRSSTAT